MTDRNVPGAKPDFGMGENRRFGDRVPADVFRHAIGVLTADDAPAELRAAPELRRKMNTLVDGFDAAVRAYRKEHSKEIDELRKVAGELRDGAGRGGDGGGRGKPPARREEMMKSDEDLTPDERKTRESARAKLRELRAGAPKIEDIYTKVWTELSAPQRAAVQAELDEWRDEQSRKREDEYVRRQLNRKDATPPPPARPRDDAGDEMKMAPDKKSDGGVDPRVEQDKPRAEKSRTDARRDRLLRIFAQLTPDEQEQLLARLEARAKDRRRPDGAAPKPAADPDQVNVPKPDSDKK